MEDKLKDEFARAIHACLRNLRVPDPIGITEKVVAAVELIYNMNHQDEGIGALPEALRDPEITPPPPAKRAVVPSETQVPGAADTPKSSVILMPGDKNFSEPASIREKKTITALKVRRTPIRPASNSPAQQYWDYSDLLQEIEKSTPPTLEFDTTDRDGNVVHLRVNRNCHAQIGLGNVLLTYKHGSVSDTVSGNVTVDLIAKHPFSLYDQEQNIEQALESIMVQLKGMYKPRAETMEPLAGPDPGPLRLDMKNQPGEFYEANLQAGSPTVANPQQEVISGVRRSNDQLAPMGRRFK